MSFTASNGKIVRLVEEEVSDEAQTEQELQNEMDEAQNELNTHQANASAVESELEELEAKVAEKEAELADHQAKVEAAQNRVTKSVDDKNAWDAARSLRDEQLAEGTPEPASEPAEGADGDGAEAEAAESEAVEVPVTVNAEG